MPGCESKFAWFLHPVKQQPEGAHQHHTLFLQGSVLSTTFNPHPGRPVCCCLLSRLSPICKVGLARSQRLPPAYLVSYQTSLAHPSYSTRRGTCEDTNTTLHTHTHTPDLKHFYTLYCTPHSTPYTLLEADIQHSTYCSPLWHCPQRKGKPWRTLCQTLKVQYTTLPLDGRNSYIEYTVTFFSNYF